MFFLEFFIFYIFICFSKAYLKILERSFNSQILCCPLNSSREASLGKKTEICSTVPCGNIRTGMDSRSLNRSRLNIKWKVFKFCSTAYCPASHTYPLPIPSFAEALEITLQHLNKQTNRKNTPFIVLQNRGRM